ncbi:MAG: hypothetical protein GYB53_20045 [Rhodobacteraceae bacterium]|nr:hypothetical protein [Paracoccaceae bacterium]MBR9823654.1 hypothetical protein [Paracoccaceae bacterium]
MRVACVTMVWRDHHFLDLWVRYYGALFGRTSLYVLSHGGEPEIARIAEGCNVIAIPRDPPDARFDETRWEMLSDIASGLVRYHDRVIVGDVDELIISLTPGEDLASHLAAAELGPVTAPAGYELFPEDELPLDLARPVLQQCPSGVLSASYSKPGILTAPARLTAGGHGVRQPFDLRPELALLHLRFLNTPELVARRRQRQEIAREASLGSDRSQAAFLRGWRRAEEVREKIAARFHAGDIVPSAEAPERARQVLEAARKRKGDGHQFSVPKVREQDFRILLDPALRELF